MHEMFFSVYSRMFWILLTTHTDNEEGIQLKTDDMDKDVYFGGMEYLLHLPLRPSWFVESILSVTLVLVSGCAL